MRKQQRYTPEFRAEAVKLVTEQGLSQEAAAKRLSVPKGTIGNWVAAAKASNGTAVPGARSAKELEAENAQVAQGTATPSC
jgi:transposase-like protein